MIAKCLNLLLLPETIAGRDEGWQPIRTNKPPSKQMGQSSITFNPQSSSSSLLARQSERGLPDLFGATERIGVVVDMMNH